MDAPYGTPSISPELINKLFINASISVTHYLIEQFCDKSEGNVIDVTAGSSLNIFLPSGCVIIGPASGRKLMVRLVFIAVE